MKKCIISVFIGLLVTITANANENKINIFLIGDSIVANYSPIEYPLTGWGQLLSRIFNDNVSIINSGIGGRSSKSYRDEGHWKKVLKQLKPGDLLFIQWGHNDQYPKYPKRYSDPDHAFQNNLKKYISEAKAVGATPILVVMPIRGWGFSKNGTYKETHMQRQKKLPEGIKKTDTSYPTAVRKVAEEMNVPLIDLHKESLAFLKEKKYDEIKTYYMSFPPNKYDRYPKGKNDLEHFSFKGAAMLNMFISKEILKLQIPLAKQLKSEKDIIKALKDTQLKKEKIDISSDNLIKTFDLSANNYKRWKKSKDQELTLSREVDSDNKSILNLSFKIDHQQGSYDGKYPKSWPRAYYNFKRDSANLNEYDFITFYVKINSNREKAKTTILSITFNSYTKAKTKLAFDLGVDNKESWKFITISIKDILSMASFSSENFNNLKTMQLVIAEKNYKDQTELQIKVKDLQLIKLKNF